MTSIGSVRTANQLAYKIARFGKGYVANHKYLDDAMSTESGEIEWFLESNCNKNKPIQMAVRDFHTGHLVALALIMPINKE
jgi:RsiW-degrading membrane proteinase PrsW (M82 family)